MLNYPSYIQGEEAVQPAVNVLQLALDGINM